MPPARPHALHARQRGPPLVHERLLCLARLVEFHSEPRMLSLVAPAAKANVAMVVAGACTRVRAPRWGCPAPWRHCAGCGARQTCCPDRAPRPRPRNISYHTQREAPGATSPVCRLNPPLIHRHHALRIVCAAHAGCRLSMIQCDHTACGPTTGTSTCAPSPMACQSRAAPLALGAVRTTQSEQLADAAAEDGSEVFLVHIVLEIPQDFSVLDVQVVGSHLRRFEIVDHLHGIVQLVHIVLLILI